MRLNGYILISRGLVVIGVLAFLVSGPPGLAATVFAVGLGTIIDLLWRLVEETRAYRSILVTLSEVKRGDDQA